MLEKISVGTQEPFRMSTWALALVSLSLVGNPFLLKDEIDQRQVKRKLLSNVFSVRE